jgi:hypothetical protein
MLEQPTSDKSQETFVRKCGCQNLESLDIKDEWRNLKFYKRKGISERGKGMSEGKDIRFVG